MLIHLQTVFVGFLMNLQIPIHYKTCETFVFQKGYCGSKESFRPFNILSVMSKIFEKLLCKQLTVFADQIFSKYQCGFRKSFSAQYPGEI